MRDLPVGNGSLLVTFDDKYQIRDVYFPHVGQENHTQGFPFRFGVWTEDEFSWVSENSWKKTLAYLPETLVTDVSLSNEKLDVEIICNDTVCRNENIFLRKIKVKNLRDKKREIRLFFHQDFRIYENKIGDTAFYDPESFSLIHYKKNRYFLINTAPHFDKCITGRKAFRDQDGTWRDAEDGEINGSLITEGAVDSTIQKTLTLEPKSNQEFFYWIAAGKSLGEVSSLNQFVKDETPESCFKFTKNYWGGWVNKEDKSFGSLSKEVIDLYKKSLLIIRTQIDNGGAILAANDYDVTERATDHYSYLWTRDGAFIANALDLAGYESLSRKFFILCLEIVHNDGYFLQKYNPDGTLASGWHSYWDAWAKRKLIPIQEDETALVIWALWEHYKKFQDIEFISKLYKPLIRKCADFMCDFRYEDTKLPKASWNLWEDRRGIHTFTCASVVGGLRAAASFANLFGEENITQKYNAAASEIVEAMKEHLYSEEKGRFLRALNSNDDFNFEADETIDASMFGIYHFGALDPNDDLVKTTMRKIEEELWVEGEIGGIARFSEDGYMRVSDDFIGNAWVICTLWLADYKIAAAKTVEDLDDTIKIFEWTAKRALKSGVLAEQINPLDGSSVSVSPLTWSHSTFVAAVEKYFEKLKILKNQ